MALFRKPGALGAEGFAPNIEDGTLVRAQSPIPGPVGVDGELAIMGNGSTLVRRLPPQQGLPQLRKGDRGKYVRWLQVLLNQHKAAEPLLKGDGYFGPKTLEAVIAFQRSRSLLANGIVGMQTWRKVLLEQARSRSSTNSKSNAGSAVADWPLRKRFEEVLRLAPQHMPSGLAAQFRAMVTPLNAGIMAGTLSVWALSHAFGAGEVADIGLLAVGTLFLGTAAFRAGEDMGACVMTTLHADTATDLDHAADYLAEAIVILGVVAFLSLLTRVSARFGGAASSAAEDVAAADNEAGTWAQPAKTKAADEPTQPPANPTQAGPQLRSDLGDKWLDESGNPKWPPNNGAAGEEKAIVLQEGTTIDRYGGEKGSFASSPGASYDQRSLPYDPASVPYRQYEVLKPLPAMESEAAPWFDQPGGAPQYRFTTSIRDLVEQGFLKAK